MLDGLNGNKKVVVSAGVGTVLVAGAAFLIAWKGRHYYDKFQSWKKGKIEDAYYSTRDEEDVAWG